MKNLHTGTVTFLFTGIEGSTKLFLIHSTNPVNGINPPG